MYQAILVAKGKVHEFEKEFNIVSEFYSSKFLPRGQKYAKKNWRYKN